MSLLIVGIVFSWLIVSLFVLLGTWLGFQLVHQNGRLLAHLEGPDAITDRSRDARGRRRAAAARGGRRTGGPDPECRQDRRMPFATKRRQERRMKRDRLMPQGRRVLPALMASLWLLPAAARAAQQYTQSLSFQTSNQSQWAAGPQYVASWSDEFSRSWNGSIGGGSFTDLSTPSVTIGDCSISCSTIPGISLGKFGAEATASTSGEIGLRPGVSVNGGAVNVSYPVQVTIQYPDPGTLYPGDPFTLFTSFVPASGGSLTTSSPHARVTVDAILNATFSASAQVKAFGADLFSESLTIPPIGSDNWTTILDTDNQVFQDLARAAQFLVNYSYVSGATNGIVSGGFKNLSIDTSGGLLSNSNSLASSHQDTFFTMRLDFSNAALAAAGLPGFNKTINLGHGLQAALQILDAYEQLALEVGQTFRFDPTPELSLQLSNGQTINLNAGQSTALTFPTVSAGATSNNLTVAPSYSLDGQLSNHTDLIISPTLNFTPLNIAFSGSLDAHPLPDFDVSFSLKPVATQTLSEPNTSISLFNQSFPLQGFQPTTTTPFTLVGYTYPLPTLTGITPPAFKPGATTQLTAAGTNFVPSHTNAVTTLPSTTARWNGSNHPTQYGSGTQLTFNLSAAEANTEGIYTVDVTNPAPGGGTSNTQQVIIDGTPPVTAAALSGPQNANNHGWYKGSVTVNLSTNDTLSGVAEVDYAVDGGASRPNITHAALGPGTFATPSFIVAGEARHHFSYNGTDNVANAEAQKSQEIDIDGTPPVVTYTGNAGSYTVDQQVNITCSSADPNLADGEAGSGVFSNTCQNIVGPAYAFKLGSNTFSASATDVAGNVGSASTSFTVQVTYDTLCNLVNRFVTDPSVAASLCSQLSQAKAAAARGDLKTKANILAAFVSLVQAQTGKSITPANAAVLTQLANAL
jgi:hypothetical protein